MKTPRLAALLAAFALTAGSALAQPTPPGWTPLFNGKDLTGWTAHWSQKPIDKRSPAALFTVENGVIHVYAKAKAGSRQAQAFIQTEAEHSNYRLSLEYKWGAKQFQPRVVEGRDAGLLYHAHGGEPLSWPLGLEFQIEDGDTGDLWTLSTRATSSVLPETGRYAPATAGGVPTTVGAPGDYGRVRHGALSELPEAWNTLELIVKGDRATHIVNGFVSLRAHDLKRWDAAAKAWVPLLGGKLALLAESTEIFYRNIRIRPLTAEEMQ